MRQAGIVFSFSPLGALLFTGHFATPDSSNEFNSWEARNTQGELAAKDSFQTVKLQSPVRATVCSHSRRDMAASGVMQETIRKLTLSRKKKNRQETVNIGDGRLY